MQRTIEYARAMEKERQIIHPAPFSARASIWKSTIVIGKVTAQRSTLSAEHVDQILFLQKNLVLPVIREK